MALNLFGGGKADHPFADPRRARQIVSELPANDAAKALAEATEWLESINHADGLKLDRRFECVDLLDGAAKNFQRKLAQDYLALRPQQKIQEHRIWTVSFGFWKQLGDAYIRCVHEHETNMSGAAAIRKDVPVIVARAMRALTLQLKWILLHYGLVEPRIWTYLSRLYRLAEKKGCTDDVLDVYPGAHGSSTVKREFLKAMMLSASSPDGLAPVKLEIAERVVAHFAESYMLSAQPDGCIHYFDLAAPVPPVRVLKGAEPKPTLRFFGAGKALERLERLAEQIKASGVVPEDINLGGRYDREIVLGVLAQLAQCWSDKPPARSSERRIMVTGITVVPGFGEILDMLDPAATDELDFSKQQPAESWIVENVSEGGCGAIVPSQKSDWLKVGTLIGAKGETAEDWGIGLIRRIGRDDHQQRRVGIQLLTQAAVPVKVTKPGAPGAAAAGRAPQAAILLSTTPDEQGEVGVVLRGGQFNGRDSLEVRVKDKSYLLMPVRMVEGGEDFDWAKFKLMQRSA